MSSRRVRAARRELSTACCAASATSRRSTRRRSSRAKLRWARSSCSKSTRPASTRWTARFSVAIIDKFDGGPVGVESLAAAVGEESDTIEEVYEPYLLQEGFWRGLRAAASPPSARIRTSAAPAAALCSSNCFDRVGDLFDGEDLRSAASPGRESRQHRRRARRRRARVAIRARHRRSAGAREHERAPAA